jgi:hypothetical protein
MTATAIETFGLASGALTVISYILYTKDIFGGKVKPEPISWLIWSVTGGIAFFSQLAKGGTYSLWFPGLDFLASVFIFILSLKFGFDGLTKQDSRALKIAGFGLVLWALSSDSIYALILTIFIDGLGTFLTVRKTFERPYTETYPMWTLLAVASGAAALAVGKYDPKLLLYPVYTCVAAVIVIGTIFLGRRVRKHEPAEMAKAPVVASVQSQGPQPTG